MLIIDRYLFVYDWVGVSTGPKNFKKIVRFSGSGGGLTKYITKIQVACLCLYNDDPF